MNSDTSEFPRRSAVRILHGWYKSGILAEDWPKVTSQLPVTSLDADWEVKLEVLQFWESILKNHCSELESQEKCGEDLNSEGHLYNNTSFTSCEEIQERNKDLSGNQKMSLFRFIVDYKLCDSLTLGFNDPERTVKLKACQMAKNILKLLSESHFLQEDQFGDSYDKDFGDKFYEFINMIKNMDLDVIILECNKSTDEYCREPESLLDDVIASLQMAAHPDEDDQNVIIDCY